MTESVAIKLGDLARDRITGFEGVVISRHEYLNGCIRFAVQPRELKEGKPIEPEVFDIEQLELVAEKQPEMQLTRSGGPMPTPAARMVPRR
jgi:hypothetical protein